VISQDNIYTKVTLMVSIDRGGSFAQDEKCEDEEEPEEETFPRIKFSSSHREEHSFTFV
jgi:hypothetical protein